jgi:hypothetical protein
MFFRLKMRLARRAVWRVSYHKVTKALSYSFVSPCLGGKVPIFTINSANISRAKNGIKTGKNSRVFSNFPFKRAHFMLKKVYFLVLFEMKKKFSPTPFSPSCPYSLI